jgi:uncharacterized protein (DUF1501 family)
MPLDHPSTRRDFLKATAAGAASLALPMTAPATPRSPLGSAKACIFINLIGGPSHLDTFDPKPAAPSDVRGPFRPIQTRVPGLHLSELFPQLATVADKFSLIRSMHHDAPPIHEAGLQLLNTGRLFRDGPEWPSMGAVVAELLAERTSPPPWWVVPDTAVSTGISVSHGQGQGFLTAGRGPKATEASREVQMDFGALLTGVCFALDEGARFVTVNMYDTVFDTVSWDCHADRGSLNTTLDDIRKKVAPRFDSGFSDLIRSLDGVGLLDTTLVVATGEFGRTPKLNANGGRDHWANCWTALVAGGGVKGGHVVGASDAIGGEPADRPVTPQELVATAFHALGVPTATIPGPTGEPVAVYPAAPVTELF